MKIEIGESLMLSWLRHVKRCQSVQLNWKPSINHWELSNEEGIGRIMQEVNYYFETKHSLNIFKNNKSYLQLLQQGELDALGLQIQNGVVKNIYGVDVAFHESGLNYGSKIETVERVIKKIVRTSMFLYGYFNMREGTIVFASPKIHNAISEPLHTFISELESLYSSLGLDFEIEILSNDVFKKQILDPVIGLSATVADTSELFLRSIQMYNMFASNEAVFKSEKSHVVKPDGDASSPKTNEVPISILVRETFSELVKRNKLPKEKVWHLCDPRYSKETFQLPYPMLLKVNEGVDSSKQRKDNRGYDRYFAKPLYFIHGERYFLCNHWIEKSRLPYKSWLERMINV